jgi:hypothetical protein
MPRIEAPYFHRVDGLLVLAPRPVPEEEFLAALREAVKSLGVLPETVEIIADGYAGYTAEPGPPRDFD